MARVVIDVNPHKRSATVEIVNHREEVVRKSRFGTRRDGYQAMLAAGRDNSTASGRSKATAVSAGTSLTASSPTAEPAWTCGNCRSRRRPVFRQF
jgi:hypothetical protein